MIFIRDAYIDLLRIRYGQHKVHVTVFNAQAIKSLTVVLNMIRLNIYMRIHVYHETHLIKTCYCIALNKLN